MLEADLSTYKSKILKILVECAVRRLSDPTSSSYLLFLLSPALTSCSYLLLQVKLPDKCTIYTTLIGLLNTKNYNFGGKCVATLLILSLLILMPLGLLMPLLPLKLLLSLLLLLPLMLLQPLLFPGECVELLVKSCKDSLKTCRWSSARYLLRLVSLLLLPDISYLATPTSCSLLPRYSYFLIFPTSLLVAPDISYLATCTS